MALIIYFLWLVLAVVMQVLIFNHLSLFGGVVMLYLLALLKMPAEVNRSVQILVGFLTGFVIDIFCNTPGMHALAAGTVMFVRAPYLNFFINDPEYKTGSVGLNRFGFSVVCRYALVMLLLHAILLYGIEAFTLFNFVVLISKILISVVLSLALGLAVEFASLKKIA